MNAIARPSSNETGTLGYSVATDRCHLLRLPAELRCYIYELALWHPFGVFIDPKTRKVPDNHTALVKTCKLIRAECGNIYFDLNTFIFTFQEERIRDRVDTNIEERRQERTSFNTFILRNVIWKRPKFHRLRMELGSPHAEKDENIISSLRGFVRLSEIVNNGAVRLSFSTWLTAVDPPLPIHVELSSSLKANSEVGSQIQSGLTSRGMSAPEINRLIQQTQSDLSNLFFRGS